ncbi:hypothetical protein KLP40_20230 [Hymenobacter sp. NST-14]|uniref:DUF5691 domain-containing protein n=1 Tax=Hymenobacter piscis TaxID=2839984 RepID=UPI001C012453|nr:DUF5691 domain-containing protein [Hymenobacter piscis]MBT9395504.1 hypothetical protein [Hymenobacter piscis]
MILYSEDQAQAFVTDAGTLQRGRQLAQPAKWGHLGRTAASAWGECAGSGAKPYLTGIDLSEPAFKCSCPSRVFPCKHGAALLLLLARQPALFAGSAAPAWLAEWLAKRQQTQEKKTEKVVAAVAQAAAGAADTSPAAAPTPAGEVSAARLARMVQGADELETWLLDLVRHGLATLDQQPARFWETQAARLVDNQLPGLAGTVRELAALRHAHADWPARLLARLGELYWLVRAFQSRDQLPAPLRQDVLQQVGVTLKKEELADFAPPVTDTWQVLGQLSWDEDRLTARRSWLRGEATGRYALVLEFAFGHQAFATPLVPQGRYTGALLFYPGPLPLRAAPVALVYAGSAGSAAATAAPPAGAPGQLLSDYADALARQPWLREWPAALAQVVPTRQPDGSWGLHHSHDEAALPLRLPDEDAAWQLLAESGGHPLTLFGEWDGRAFRPLHSWPAPTHPVPTHPAAAVRSALPDLQAVATGPEPAPGPGEQEAGQLPEAAQLLRVALLGTRQSGETVPAVLVGTTSADGPEQRLLLAAGTLALVQKAGFLPPVPAARPPAPAPAETGQPLGPSGTECLRALLDSNRYAEYRSDYWIQLEQHHRLIPPALLVSALHNADLRRHLPGSFSAILGERGRWLAAQNPAWQPVPASRPTAPPADELATWETGSLPERASFIRHLHQTDPAQARQLLAAALPTERAATQAALLAQLEPAVSPADEALLAAYLRSKSKEVRQTVLPLLVRLPQSALVARLWERAAPLLTLRRPLLGRSKLEVILPAAWDKTWLTDGIEQKTTGYEGGERAGQLGQLLALLPPARWSAHLGVEADELLVLAEASDWGPLLRRAWARAATLHASEAFAGPLLRHYLSTYPRPPGFEVGPLLELLGEAEKLALLRGALPGLVAGLLGRPPDFLPELLPYLARPWPADIVRAVLRYLSGTLAPGVSYPYGQTYQRLTSLLQELPRALPQELEAEVTSALEALSPRYPVVAPLIGQFTDSLHFRRQLAASLTEPSTAFND